MANNTPSTPLQDAVLNYLIKNKVPVTVFVGNGAQMRGRVCFHDKYCIFILDDERHQQNLVYKGAMSTISPRVMINMAELTKAISG